MRRKLPSAVHLSSFITQGYRLLVLNSTPIFSNGLLYLIINNGRISEFEILWPWVFVCLHWIPLLFKENTEISCLVLSSSLQDPQWFCQVQVPEERARNKMFSKYQPTLVRLLSTVKSAGLGQPESWRDWEGYQDLWDSSLLLFLFVSISFL